MTRDPAPPEAVQADWIAADWGTSRLRLWAMSAAGQPLAKRENAHGMASLKQDQFEHCFLDAIADWHAPGAPLRAVVCGMAGAREGWVDAGYRRMPASLREASRAVAAPAHRQGFDIRILPGLAQDDPPDVMRGEETQIAGLLLERPDFDGLVVLPGTHTKWARVSEGRVSRFSTFMTGELFALFRRHSILARCLQPEGAWNWAEFDRAFEIAAGDPAGFSRRLFGLRAAALLHGAEPDGLRARLSAELIGAEIAANLTAMKGLDVVLIGTADLAALYARGLSLLGIAVEICPDEALTLAGLVAAWRGMSDA